MGTGIHRQVCDIHRGFFDRPGYPLMSLLLYAVANLLYAQAIPSNLLVVASACYLGIVIARRFFL
jgi:hypothetical protein